jgi:hypothetical protein
MGSSSSPPARLSPIQREVLARFFAHESGFWLSGGAALAGYHLGHRTTSDLDLFTDDDDAFERARHVVPALAADLALRLDVRQEAPGFRRYALTGSGEGVVVDLVRERVVQGRDPKGLFGGVRVDPPSEILANKLGAIVGRSEERDLVDIMFLERSGLDVADALPLATAKDGACTAANLAWLLSQVSIPENAALPAGVSPTELRTYLDELVRRLRRLAAPAPQ